MSRESRDPRLWLSDIVEASARIAEYVAGMNEDAFRSDRKTVDAVVRNLEVIGEAVKQLQRRHAPPNLASSGAV